MTAGAVALAADRDISYARKRTASPPPSANRRDHIFIVESGSEVLPMTNTRSTWRMPLAAQNMATTIAAVALIFSVQGMAPERQNSMNRQSVVADNIGAPAPPGNGAAKAAPLHPCTRICVKSKPGGPASPGQCLQWKTVC
jgi:hypothetical protein